MIDRRRIFLVDGLGAVLSATMLGLVLPALQRFVGMPLRTLYGLSVLALVFATYSLCCYALADHSNPRWLRLICSTNLCYCALTLVLVAVYHRQLNWLGMAYFFAEMMVILALVWLEKRLLATLAGASV